MAGSVIHADSHLDTWGDYPGTHSEQARITHGTFFAIAQEEGLISNNSVHAGIRCKMVVCICGDIDILNNDIFWFSLKTWTMTKPSDSKSYQLMILMTSVYQK